MRHHLGTRTAQVPLTGSERLLVGLRIVGVAALVGVLRLLPPVRRAVSLADGSVSSLATLDPVRTQPPEVWVGRTVLVQGQAALDRSWQPPDSIVTRIALIDPHQAGAIPLLVLDWGRADPVLDALRRRLPVVGRLAPRPQRLQWGRVAVYRIRLDGVAPGGGAGCTACSSMRTRAAPKGGSIGCVAVAPRATGVQRNRRDGACVVGTTSPTGDRRSRPHVLG